MDSATIKFRHTLPYAVFHADPALAALHAARARTLHPDHSSLPSLSCSRCGSLLPLQHSTASAKNKSIRIHRRSCRICGDATESILPKSAFPPTRKHRTIATQPPPATAQPLPHIITTPEQPPKPRSPAPQTTAPSKARPKKKSGLQQLLARNRENEEMQRQKQEQAASQFSGLAAFLTDLR